jgi:hypothetical protein
MASITGSDSIEGLGSTTGSPGTAGAVDNPIEHPTLIFLELFTSGANYFNPHNEYY